MLLPAYSEGSFLWDCRLGATERLRGPPGMPSSSGRGLRVELSNVTFGCARMPSHRSVNRM